MAWSIVPLRALTGGKGRRWGLLGLALMLASSVSLRAQTVNSLVPLTAQVWSYNDAGIDLETAWRAELFAGENQWPTGTALFGVESSYPFPYPVPLRTPLVLNSGRVTYYFRTHFQFSGSTNGILLLGSAYVDDGAVFYLNGADCGRIRLPSGPITYSTKADPAFPEGQESTIEFPVGLLAQGDNVLAVEVHQSSDSSSDVVFGMSLDTYSLQAPALLDPTQPADQRVPEGAPVTLSVSASGFPPPSYQWFRNGLPISGATGPDLFLPSVGADQAGNYYVSVTNQAGKISSRTAVVQFIADTTPPSVLYAIGQADPTTLIIVFSKPLEPNTAIDPLNWMVTVAGGGPELLLTGDGVLTDGTNLVLNTDPRDPTLRYEATTLVPIPDSHGNELPQGTVIPIASFALAAVPDSQVWRYNQSGEDLGTQWRAGTYDDSGWLVGAEPFDVWRRFADTTYCRTSLPEPSGADVRTCLSLSNIANTAQIPTSYFRTHFQIDGDPSDAVIHLTALINDGAVFYLNGEELARVGMPAGPVTYNTLAERNPVTPGSWFTDDSFLPAPSLAPGDNVLAIELHQHSLDSPDLTLVFAATALLTGPPAVHPTINFQMEGATLHLSWSAANGTLEAAPDLGGPWTPVVISNPPSDHFAAITDPRRYFRVSVP